MEGVCFMKYFSWIGGSVSLSGGGKFCEGEGLHTASILLGNHAQSLITVLLTCSRTCASGVEPNPCVKIKLFGLLHRTKVRYLADNLEMGSCSALNCEGCGKIRNLLVLESKTDCKIQITGIGMD